MFQADKFDSNISYIVTGLTNWIKWKGPCWSFMVFFHFINKLSLNSFLTRIPVSVLMLPRWRSWLTALPQRLEFSSLVICALGKFQTPSPGAAVSELNMRNRIDDLISDKMKMACNAVSQLILIISKSYFAHLEMSSRMSFKTVTKMSQVNGLDYSATKVRCYLLMIWNNHEIAVQVYSSHHLSK